MQVDVVIVGAGAAGLMAGIWAGRTHPGRSILVLDGSEKLGRKILISGGGRCNVTHFQVSERDFAGSSPNGIKKVLRRFEVAETVAFFRELGVELKQETTGKLFPISDKANTVLAALLGESGRVGVQIEHPRRVEGIELMGNGFGVWGAWGKVSAGRVILATGGKSVPQTGSDGQGYLLAQAMGHGLTPRIFPALVPLLLPAGHFICDLSGLTLPTTLTLETESGKKLVSFTNSTLCTRFGLSGPAALDISRYVVESEGQGRLMINWLPGREAPQIDQELQNLGQTSLLRYLRDQLPERLARALCLQVGVEIGEQLTRERRKALAQALTHTLLPVIGNRGFAVAEATAGGVPLSEIQLHSMESRLCPGLFLCGEICDVDGRIGGFNFQWAWASGYTAGVSV